MKKHCFLSLIALSICITSCSRFIGPPMVGASNIGYLSRPFITDSAKSQTYISGEFSASASSDDHTEINSGILNINRGYANKNFNASIGAFGFLGGVHYRETYTDFNNNSNPVTTTDEFRKTFGGWGIRSIIGLQTVSNNKLINTRIISWESAYSQEYGNYAKFRNTLTKDEVTNNNDAYIYVSALTKVFTTGFSSEILWNEAFDSKDFTLGARGFIGFSPRIASSYYEIPNSNYEDVNRRSIVLLGSLFLRYKKIFGTLQVGSGDKIYGGKFGFGYTF